MMLMERDIVVSRGKFAKGEGKKHEFLAIGRI